jgi:hypothetical protein
MLSNTRPRSNPPNLQKHQDHHLLVLAICKLAEIVTHTQQLQWDQDRENLMIRNLAPTWVQRIYSTASVCRYRVGKYSECAADDVGPMPTIFVTSVEVWSEEKNWGENWGDPFFLMDAILLVLHTKVLDIVFRFIIEYNSWMDFYWPLGNNNNNRSILIWGFLKDDILACVETWDSL